MPAAAPAISAHFTLEELTRSQTATRLRIANKPDATALANLERLCRLMLEPIRARLGGVHVDSAYRSRRLNTAIGGSAKSQHMKGLAADIVIAGLSALEVCQWIVDQHLPFDQLICEGSWTHVSVAAEGETPRGEVLTAHFGAGRATYTPGLPGQFEEAA